MRSLFLLLLLFLLTSPSLSAQETEGFETDLNAGFTLTTGNSETTLINLGVDAKNIKEKYETLLSGDYDYGRTTEELDSGEEVESTHLDRGKLVAQSNWLLSDQMYLFYNLTAEKDEKAKVDYRINNGPGIGVYFLRDDTRLLNVETGIVYVFEDVDGMSDDYAALRLAQKAEYKFSDNAKIWQKLEAVMNVSETNAFFMNAEIGVESKLNDRLALRVVLKDKYDNDPEGNVEKNDLTLFSGISVQL